MIAAVLVVGMALTGIEEAGFLWPDMDDLRMQKITRMVGEKDWPFVAQSGRIFCVKTWIEDEVYFIPDGTYNYRRAFLLDTDMFQMTTVNYGMNDILVQMKSAREVVERIMPYVTQGKMLCKHNDGPVVPGAEL